MSQMVEPLALPTPLYRRVREVLLLALFAALAFSISCSESLLALLVLLVVPWVTVTHTFGRGHWLARAARESWRDSEALRHHPLTPPLLAFVALSLLSALFSGDAGWSLWVARDTLRITTFYLMLWYTRDAAHALKLWTAFLVVLTAMATYGLGQAYLCGVRPGLVPADWLARVCIHTSAGSPKNSSI